MLNKYTKINWWKEDNNGILLGFKNGEIFRAPKEFERLLKYNWLWKVRKKYITTTGYTVRGEYIGNWKKGDDPAIYLVPPQIFYCKG